ncbi:MAG: C4-type zinc ribbon domain-containing protein [Candidatus Babeliales bacterium]|nr:C4-type zinc ribbon domain-containing protein [Candidatus Omnitrophota bacterium]
MSTPNISEELKKLVELQKMDRQIFELNRKQAEVPVLLEALQKEFEDKKTTYKSLEESKQKMQLRQKEKEGELAAKEEGIKKSQGQLGQLKTNKEYQTKLAEIESLKADKSIIEEEILKLMDEIEQAKSSVENEKKALGDEEKIYNDKKRVIEEQSKEMQAALQALEGRRKIASADVDKKILQMYEHILHGRGGVALVSVINNSCEGCHMRVPHQVIHEIKMYHHLITCESCARILYLEEDVQP